MRNQSFSWVSHLRALFRHYKECVSTVHLLLFGAEAVTTHPGMQQGQPQVLQELNAILFQGGFTGKAKLLTPNQRVTLQTE